MRFGGCKIAVIALLVVVGGSLFAQQLTPRVKGLENDTIYMSLLKQENTLQIKEDSVVVVLDKTRGKFRTNPEQRAAFGAEILRLEGELFDIRNEIGLVESKLSEIEQEFVINNLGQPAKAPATRPVVTAAQSNEQPSEHANLASNGYFKKNLTPKDYNALVNAQRKEMSIVNYLKIYLTNYNTLQKLDQSYQEAKKARPADSIYTKYKLINALNAKIADSISSIWDNLHDNKAYAYSYLLDKMNQNATLENHEKLLAKVRQQKLEMRDRYASDVVAAYPLSKKMLLDYEISLAGILDLKKSVDSLTKVMKSVDTLNLMLPKIDIAERNFIDYHDITIAARTPYSTANPIPKCVIYPRGTVYRILLGSYTKAQSPVIFKGVSPLCYIYGADKRHNYYAGGYATSQEAENAVEELQALGFRRPEIVVWENGAMSNYTKQLIESNNAKSEGTLYRIEISCSSSDLPPAVKLAIIDQGEGAEISRIANQASTEHQYTFIIGTFATQVTANKLLQTISQIDSVLPVRITTITI